MLADAIRSESYRIIKNRMTMFWSVLFVPLLFVVGGFAYQFISKARTADIAEKAALPAELTQSAVNVGDSLTFATGMGANFAVLVFSLVAAATLYAGDYRWETWRLISARNSRLNLMLSKVVVFAILALAGMGLFLIATLLFAFSEALAFSRPLSFSISGEAVGQAALMGLLSWLRIVQYAMLALLTAAITRSMLAALFVPFVIGFAQSLLGGPGLVFLGWNPTMWQTQLLLPGLAFDTLKAAIAPEFAESFRVAMSPDTPAPMRPDDIVVKASLSLALWTLVPLAGALAWFKRQDLSKE